MSEEKKPEATAKPPRLTEEALAGLERLAKTAAPGEGSDRPVTLPWSNLASLVAEVREARKARTPSAEAGLPGVAATHALHRQQAQATGVCPSCWRTCPNCGVGWKATASISARLLAYVVGFCDNIRRATRPGWVTLAMHDPVGRRGLWMRRTDDTLEISSGREGENVVSLRVGETITEKRLYELEQLVLDNGRWTLELAEVEALKLVDEARAVGAEAVDSDAANITLSHSHPEDAYLVQLLDANDGNYTVSIMGAPPVRYATREEMIAAILNATGYSSIAEMVKALGSHLLPFARNAAGAEPADG